MNTCLLHVENAENCSNIGFSTPGVDSSFTARRRCTTDAAKVLCLNLDLIAKIMYPVMILKMVPRGEKKQTQNTLFLSVFPRNQLLLIYLSVLKVIAQTNFHKQNTSWSSDLILIMIQIQSIIRFWSNQLIIIRYHKSHKCNSTRL